MELMNKAKIEAAVTFEDETGKHDFSEGDNVICVVNENRYEGIITCVGTYKDEVEEFTAFILDTSKSKLSHSTEIIKLDDVTYMCKNPLINTKELSQEEVEKQMFSSMLHGLGFKSEGREFENLYQSLRKVSEHFNIPFVKVESAAIYSLKTGCKTSEALKKYCGIDEEQLIELLGEGEYILKDIKMNIEKSIGTLLVGGLLLGAVGLASFVND